MATVDCDGGRRVGVTVGWGDGWLEVTGGEAHQLIPR